jgi:hypothetical protein
MEREITMVPKISGRISKKGTYGSRKNEFYYALGLMANKAGKTMKRSSFSENLYLKKFLTLKSVVWLIMK